MKTIIHVNRQIIAANAKNGTDEPSIIVRNYKTRRNVKSVRILGSSIISQNRNPLSCGARVWIETESEIEVID